MTPELQNRMQELSIDIPLTREILARLNDPSRKEPETVKVSGLPGIDGKRVLDRRGDAPVELPEGTVTRMLRELDLPGELAGSGVKQNGTIRFFRRDLEKIGLALLPRVAYGVLNGGSASSYGDHKKNRGFSEPLFNLCREPFERAAALCEGRAKGITPAFIHPDGTPGPSFMELKMRALLLRIRQYQKCCGKSGPVPLFPLFQMTSVLNDRQINDTLAGYAASPLLAGLIAETGVDITAVETGIQPLVAAFTPGGPGEPKEIFTSAYGKTGEPLPFPGGHGQNFAVLKDIYQTLRRQGKKFVYLGNVDNLGNLPDLAGIALLALSGKEGAFDFSFKTPVDVKGGILVEDQRGRLNCGDIGVAVPREEVEAREKEGTPILFNCATGLFNLDVLVSRLDDIIENLPLRTSIQDKDPGRYAQTEQVTWEVLGMLDDFLVYGVDKNERFLASKLLLENLLTSGIGLEDPRFPRDPDPAKDLYRMGEQLHRGLKAKLTGEFGLVLRGRRWEPEDPV